MQTPSQGQPYGQHQYSQQIYTVIIALVVGLILGWLNHIFAKRRDDRNRTKRAKDEFGVFISDQIGLLPKVKIRDFYILTKPAIKSEVYRLRHFLTDSQRTSLDRLWKEYDEIPEKYLSEERENKYGSTWLEGAVKAVHGTPVSNPGHPKDVFKNYLDEFYKFSA